MDNRYDDSKIRRFRANTGPEAGSVLICRLSLRERTSFRGAKGDYTILAIVGGCAKIGLMLLPRFSLRTLLLGTAVCGAFFFVLAAAVQGQVWAAATTIGLGSVALGFVLYAVFFAIALIISAVNPLGRPAVVARSPFAQHVPAPQIIPQDDEAT